MKSVKYKYIPALCGHWATQWLLWAFVGLRWPSLAVVGYCGFSWTCVGRRWLLWAFVDLRWLLWAFVGLRWPSLSPVGVRKKKMDFVEPERARCCLGEIIAYCMLNPA